MKDPSVILLLRLKKDQLIRKAKEFGLSSEGNKDILAKRIAKWDESEQTRIWKAIANG